MAICEKCKSSMVIVKSNTGAKHCMNCGWDSEKKEYEKKQTNADRIRAMNDEELAKLITSGELCAICPFCKYYGTEYCYMENEGIHKNCDSGIIDWLQSEVEE